MDKFAWTFGVATFLFLMALVKVSVFASGSCVYRGDNTKYYEPYYSTDNSYQEYVIRSQIEANDQLNKMLQEQRMNDGFNPGRAQSTNDPYKINKGWIEMWPDNSTYGGSK